MQDFRIALVQHNSLLGRKPQNLDAVEKWIRRAARKQAALVCLPELAITAHGAHPSMIHDAEEVPGGPACRRMMELANELGIHICVGIAELEGGAVYNTMMLVGPESSGGYIGKQRKVHLSSDEHFLFRHGSRLNLFSLPFARIGIVICYDNEFPEPARCLAIKGAEVLLAPHAARFGKWPRDAAGRRAAVKRRMEHWKLMHRSRSLENGVFTCLCDAAGQSARGLAGVQANHAGGCMVVAPDGEVIAHSRSRDVAEEMLVVDLEAKRLNDRRERSCFTLRTRRVEAFAALTEPSA